MYSQASTKELSARLLKLYDAPLSEVKQSSALWQPNVDKKQLLEAVPAPNQPSHRPLHLLYVLLSELSGPWPVFDLIRCHTRVLKYLPEDVKTGGQGEFAWLPTATSELVKESYQGFSQFLCKDTRPALQSIDPQHFITHRGLESYVSRFRLPVKAEQPTPRVAIALPNGPLLAATCIAVTTYYTAAPINPAAGPEQFRADVKQSDSKLILTTPDDFDKLDLQAWAHNDGIQVIFVDWDLKDRITLQTIDGKALICPEAKREFNKADDIGLILFTSGTSGTKKVVPLTVHSIIAGIEFVIESWGLTPSDTCLNMMPLYHVGGLVRNIFAPMFSGGTTVCCTAFDPNMFWDVLEELRPTWYYASPSMHSVILGEAVNRPQSLKKSCIRLACNAAGGLLPSLACQLRDTFNCIVLPSYGMTECMPISTPPLDYKLDREGTSGISTGPELTILDWSEKRVPCGTVGRICVRGEPVFPGYLRPDGSYDKSPFNEQGWFDTGDLGYMDEDGYLYITGRSKEVINRGGELISPFEVENAILSAAMSTGTPLSGRVNQVLAFSAVHDVLQEVVAVALVTPPHAPRVDLRAVHSALRSSLQQVKWPVLITYMDDLPKKNNKVLRIKLGQRLKLPEVTDDMHYLDRHWEAKCPPPDTALQVDIPSSRVQVDYKSVFLGLDQVVPANLRHYYRQNVVEEGVTSLFIAPARAGLPEPGAHLSEDLKTAMGRIMHNYMLPDHVHLMKTPFKTNTIGEVDEAELRKTLQEMQQAADEKLNASTEGRVTKAFAEVLSCHPDEIPPNVDFFALGGDSLKAGKLVSMLRSAFECALSINIIFSQGTVKAIAAHIESVTDANTGPITNTVVGCTETRSSTNPFLMLLQLFPLMILYPLQRAFQWTTFIVFLNFTQQWPTNDSVVGRLFNLTLAISFARVIVRTVAPIVGILAKWIIIGRYREGLYPMWGLYHTRWWLVQKIVSICGKGFFSSNETTRRLYCRLMGARIGKGVKLAGASIGEYDLLDIRAGASLTRCVCRPFAAEGNTSMYLGRIVIGENSSIGISSIIAAGSVIPPNTCIGPNSSSWEADDADESNREINNGPANAHWLLTGLITLPLVVLAWFASLMPWFGGLIGMVVDRASTGPSSVRSTLAWFSEPERVAFHYLALVLRTLFSPFILFIITVVVKVVLDIIFGKLRPGPANSQGTVAKWRASLIKTLLPVPRLHDVTGMFGQHYEATSVAVRMLGGKIGRRVYWPGTGPSIGDYHLLDIGNDVVFGSRSHLITTDATGSGRITIRDRAMIADRVMLLPGVDIGERTIMGSGALTRRGQSYIAGGTYVGSKGGDAVCLSTGSKTEPKEKPRQRNGLAYYPSSSDVTLIEETPTFKSHPERPERPKKIQHMSSDETLAETRKEASNRAYELSAEPDSSSDSDSEYRAAEPTNDASPFGRAFYMGQASYRVMGPFTIFCYSSFMTVFTAFYWNVPNISAIQIVHEIMSHFTPKGVNMWFDVLAIWLMVAALISILTTLQAILALGIVIGSKWALMGRRKPGNYDWDKHPYCQRWQLFLCIEKLRRNCYRGNGVLGMLTGTHWIVLYFKALGADIGKDCALFANGRPSLMFTEPDLIRLGNRVTVDDASVVAHINTRGKFDLNRLEIGDRCVLRTGSRLLSGATMKDDSCLLEHTLIMGGDVVEAKWTMQGWPAERFSGRRVKGE